MRGHSSYAISKGGMRMLNAGMQRLETCKVQDFCLSPLGLESVATPINEDTLEESLRVSVVESFISNRPRGKNLKNCRMVAFLAGRWRSYLTATTVMVRWRIYAAEANWL